MRWSRDECGKKFIAEGGFGVSVGQLSVGVNTRLGQLEVEFEFYVGRNGTITNNASMSLMQV